MKAKDIELQSQLKVVSIDNIFELSNDQRAQAWFNQILQTRKTGYRCFYPEHFVSCDGSDWIDRHYLLGFENESGFKAKGCFRVSTFSTNERCRVPFPLTEGLMHANKPDHLEAVQREIQLGRQHNSDVQYGSWLTFLPELRENENHSQWFKEVVVGILCHESLTHNSIFLTAAVLQFKTYRWLQMGGYNRLELERKVLPSLKNPYSGFDIDLMVQHHPSRWAEDCLAKYRSVIESMERYEPVTQEVLKKAA